MPAVYIGAVMNSGEVCWRPKFTSGLSEDGPDDQRLIINFRGTLLDQSWVIMTSYGYAVDLDVLGVSVPVLFDKKWLQNKGLRKVSITEDGDYYVIDMQL